MIVGIILGFLPWSLVMFLSFSSFVLHLATTSYSRSKAHTKQQGFFRGKTFYSPTFGNFVSWVSYLMVWFYFILSILLFCTLLLQVFLDQRHTQNNKNSRGRTFYSPTFGNFVSSILLIKTLCELVL